tara:strand:- start:591 stop:1217 length:627 start_codon:yes stop_codon:yes gene_type:complete
MAHTVYKNIENKKIPSVTTILGRYKDSGALIRWSNAEGLKGNKYDDVIKKHQDIGTSLHELAEMHILDQYYELPKDETLICFNKFLTWWEESDYKINWTEKSLTSDLYQYGGTADVLVNDDTIIDFKTSKNFYPDYLVQGAAYMQLVEEVDKRKIKRFILARFPKVGDDFQIKEFNREQLDQGFEYFKTLRIAFDQNKELNKTVRSKK